MPPQNHPIELIESMMRICPDHGVAVVKLLLECGGVTADTSLVFTPPYFIVQLRWGRAVRPMGGS